MGMVVKTEVCHYCDLKIYPGHGTKIITREGRIFIYIHKKARSQALRKTKAQMIKWTTAWRRANKKIKTSDINKKKRRKAKSTADRDAKKNEAIRQIKERKAKIAKANKAAPTKQFAKPAQKGGNKKR